MLNRWKNQCRASWQLFREAPSGQKFQALYHARIARAGGHWGFKEIGTITAGCLLMLIGLAIGWLPGPGGFVGFIGLAMVAQYSLNISRLLDGCEHLLARCWHRFFMKTSSQPENSATSDHLPPKNSENLQ